jgi:hypothetical protein
MIKKNSEGPVAKNVRVLNLPETYLILSDLKIKRKNQCQEIFLKFQAILTGYRAWPCARPATGTLSPAPRTASLKSGNNSFFRASCIPGSSKGHENIIVFILWNRVSFW